MPITLEDLDGQYDVKSETSYGGPFHLKGDGVTIINHGLTYRKDKSGCIWESAFSIVGENSVQVESTVDPSHAGEDVYISDEKGNPTKSIVTYRSIMDARIVNGKIVMVGEIRHANETTRLTLTQI